MSRTQANLRPTAVKIAALALAAVAVAAVVYPKATPQAHAEWRSDLQGALSDSATEHKPIFVKFTAPGCVYCAMMDREVFPDARVKQAMTQFIPVALDLYRSMDVARRYGVNGVPNYLVMNAEGALLTRSAGYMPVSDFMAFLRHAQQVGSR